MAVKKYKPTIPGMRGRTGYSFEEITKDKPERSLVIEKRKRGGRNTFKAGLRFGIVVAGTAEKSAL